MEHALTKYVNALGPLGGNTIALLLAGEGEPTAEELGALRAFASDLDEALLEPWAHELPQPGSAVIGGVDSLTDHYRAAQRREVRVYADRHEWLPCLRLAWDQLQGGGLFSPDALDQLRDGIEWELRGKREQLERYTAHLETREQTARALVKQAGRLARLTRRPEDFYAQIDQERLRVCTRCGEIAFPSATEGHVYGSRTLSPQCHYCGGRSEMKPYRAPMSSTESEDPT